MTTVAVRLGDLAAALNLTRGFPTQRAVPEGDVRVMSVAMVRDASTPKHFAEREALADLGLDVAQPGDVLVAIEGGTVGESLVVSAATADFVPSQQAATLRITDPSTLDPWYLGAWLTTEPAREQLRRLARGLGIQRIPLRDLATLTVPVPPMGTQRQIGERFRAFETAVQAHRAVTACLQELRTSDLALTFANITDDEAAKEEQR